MLGTYSSLLHAQLRARPMIMQTRFRPNRNQVPRFARAACVTARLTPHSDSAYLDRLVLSPICSALGSGLPHSGLEVLGLAWQPQPRTRRRLSAPGQRRRTRTRKTVSNCFVFALAACCT